MIELPVGTWGDRGTWQGKAIASKFTNARFISVCCPICGSDSALSDYTLSADGVVAPPFMCPYGCGCRATLKLLGYADFLRSLLKPHDPEPDQPDIPRDDESNHS